MSAGMYRIFGAESSTGVSEEEPEPNGAVSGWCVIDEFDETRSVETLFVTVPGAHPFIRRRSGSWVSRESLHCRQPPRTETHTPGFGRFRPRQPSRYLPTKMCGAKWFFGTTHAMSLIGNARVSTTEGRLPRTFAKATSSTSTVSAAGRVNSLGVHVAPDQRRQGRVVAWRHGLLPARTCQDLLRGRQRGYARWLEVDGWPRPVGKHLFSDRPPDLSRAAIDGADHRPEVSVGSEQRTNWRLVTRVLVLPLRPAPDG